MQKKLKINSIRNVFEIASCQDFAARERAIDDCKDSIPVLKNILPARNNAFSGLPMVEHRVKLLPMNIDKYLNVCIDGRNDI